jgi:hypothetical protein
MNYCTNKQLCLKPNKGYLKKILQKFFLLSFKNQFYLPTFEIPVLRIENNLSNFESNILALQLPIKVMQGPGLNAEKSTSSYLMISDP